MNHSVVSDYKHHNTAHCESGVVSNLLSNHGLNISEPMIFGIGSGLFFLHLPFVKVMGLPLTSYRAFPGSIFKKSAKRLGVSVNTQRFWRENSGQKRLDELLLQKKKVGVITNIYWLDYIPQQFRFHFNGHHTLVIDKSNLSYTVSDPLLEDIQSCSIESMYKARFSKGPLSPRGYLYYLENEVLQHINWAKAIKLGIDETWKRMLYTPLPFAGVSGIHYLSQQIKKWPEKYPPRLAIKYLSSIVRMQEEIGTGGAGFRSLYASFLDEAGRKLEHEKLIQLSYEMESIADEWLQFATLAMHACKGRNQVTFELVSRHLFEIYKMEKQFFIKLKKVM